MTLTWIQQPYPVGTYESYFAQYPSEHGYDYYHVYQWKDGWAFNRTKHYILGELDGWTDRIEDAKSICEDDFAKQIRLRAWNDFMLSTDPPSIPRFEEVP